MNRKFVKNSENSKEILLFHAKDAFLIASNSNSGEYTKFNCESHSSDLTAAALSNKYIALCSTKTISIQDRRNSKLISSFEAKKTVTSMQFHQNTLYWSDKFGDVYRLAEPFSFSASHEKPILGHISMITDLRITPQYIFSADRDEKIKVSYRSNPFVVAAFMNRHTQYISSIAFNDDEDDDGKEEKMVSVGGDSFAVLWDVKSTFKAERIIELEREDALRVLLKNDLMIIVYTDIVKIFKGYAFLCDLNSTKGFFIDAALHGDILITFAEDGITLFNTSDWTECKQHELLKLNEQLNFAVKNVPVKLAKMDFTAEEEE